MILIFFRSETSGSESDNDRNTNNKETDFRSKEGTSIYNYIILRDQFEEKNAVMDNNPEPAMPKLYNNIDTSPAEGDKTSDGKMSEPNNKKINTSISPKNPEKHTDSMRKRKTTDWNSDHENTSGEEIDCNNSDSDIFDGEPFPTTSYENTSGERITKKRKSTTNVLDDIEAQPLHHSKCPNCSKPNPAVLLTRL